MSRAWEQAVVKDWSALTTAERFAHAGNTDPWAGPVDPVAAKAMQDRLAPRADGWQAKREQDGCTCWQSDCGECGPRYADGQRPPRGAQRQHMIQHDALLQRAKERAHARGLA